MITVIMTKAVPRVWHQSEVEEKHPLTEMRSMLQEMESLHLISKSLDKKPMPLPGWHCLPTHHISWVEQKLGNAHRITSRFFILRVGGTHALAAILILLRKGHFPLLLKNKSSGGKRRFRQRLLPWYKKLFWAKVKSTLELCLFITLQGARGNKCSRCYQTLHSLSSLSSSSLLNHELIIALTTLYCGLN